MKQFNLEEYLKDPSQKLITRGGRSARILCTDKEGNDYPIVALIKDNTYGELFVSYNTLGNRGSEPDKYSLYFDDLPSNFKPFDRVLTRNDINSVWCADIFSHFECRDDNIMAVCIGGKFSLNNIISFNKNKVGTLE